MNMRTIQLNISNDVFDKVMSFLEILPKNKIKIVQDNKSKKPQTPKEPLGDFFQASPLVGLDISRSSEVYKGRLEF